MLIQHLPDDLCLSPSPWGKDMPSGRNSQIMNRAYRHLLRQWAKLTIFTYAHIILIGIWGDPGIYFVRGNAYGGLGDHRRAIDDYGKAIELDPNFVTAYGKRWRAYFKLGDYWQAFKDFLSSARQ